MSDCTSGSCACETAEAPAQYERLDKAIEEYHGKAGALIPVLQAAQGIFGYLPEKALRVISEKLGEPYSKVYGVVTFYSFFSLTPRGKYLIRVCLGTACYVRGAEEVLTALKQQLAIEVGQTTKDSLFSLEVGRCFGACGLAPVIMVNDDVHQSMKSSDVEKLLRQYRAKESANAKGTP